MYEVCTGKVCGIKFYQTIKGKTGRWNSMERIEFIKLMDKFAKFYKAELSEIQTDWWFETFKDIKADDFLNALNWHITHDQYNSLPAPGKITAALAALEEDRLSKPPPYPEFTTL